MTPYWHPLSGVFLTDPPMAASRTALGMFLRAGPVEVLYVGDRMHPAIRAGERIVLHRPEGAPPARGEVVAADEGDVVDLFRVEGATGGSLRLCGDSDPGEPVVLGRDAVLGRAGLSRSPVGRAMRLRRRLGLDVREAWTGRPDAEESTTVRDKYEAQAPHYARREGLRLEARLATRIRASVPPGGSILVVGAGVGTETIALARAGFRARGIDFAPAMVAASRAAASLAGVDASFESCDVRARDEAPASLDAVLFTYDVYSFLPGSASRAATLRRIAGWLVPGGRLYLSARKVRGGWARVVLAIQRLRGARELGDSHTRWFGAGGTMRRSYVHVFTERALRREIAAAGGRCLAWEGGHGEIAFGEGR